METENDRLSALHDFAETKNLPVFPGPILTGFVLANYSPDDYYALTKTYGQARPAVIGAFNELKAENEEASIVFLKTIQILITNKDPHRFLSNIRKTNMIVDIYKKLSSNFISAQRNRSHDARFKRQINSNEEFYTPDSTDDYKEFLRVVKLIGADKERSLAELEETLSSTKGVWRERGMIAAKDGFGDIASLFK